MAESASSVVATITRVVAMVIAGSGLVLAGCGQKGALVPAKPMPAEASASSPDTLPIPGVSPADLPAPVPQR